MRDTTILECLTNQLAQTPGAIALDDGVRRLTYAQMHSEAAAVAGRLLEVGVCQHDRVGVCTPRRAESVVRIIGILLAGAAYVPLDPTYPPERLEAMCTTAEVKLIVGSAADRERFGHTARFLELRSPDSPSPTIHSAAAADPSWPACVLFTTGSTGRPKGVSLSHGSVGKLIQWGLGSFTGDELAVVAGCTSFSFDPSIFEMFVTLSAGGRLRILANALALGDLGPTDPVTMALAAPSAISELVRSRRLPTSLRSLMTGGEPLPASLANRVLDQSGVRRLVFAYGLTETTMTSSTYEVTYPATDPLPIGWELPAVDIFLLDDALVPVDEGAVGEIFVAGPQVADGYVADPDLTRERFLPCPLTAGPTTMYRTGDLARRRKDGALEFHGRADRQIKVRGHRVEPSEIEAALCLHPGISQAFVCPSTGSTDSQLIGYTVPLASEVPPAALRSHLRRILPEYMVPTSFLSLSSFPVNGSGKVERQALPAPSSGGSEWTTGTRLSPADDVVQVITSIIGEVLRLSRPAAGHDDIIDDLGATSLTAVRLLYELQEIFGVDIPLTTMLADTTVAGIIRAVRKGSDGAATALQVNPEGSAPPLVLVHAWLGAVIRYRRLGPYLSPQQPLIGIHVHDQAMVDVPVRTVEEMADRAIAQLRLMRPGGPYIVGGHSTGGLIAYEMARRLNEQDEAVPLVVLLDSPVPSNGWRYWYDEATLNLDHLRGLSLRQAADKARTFFVNRAARYRTPSASPSRRAEDMVAQTSRSNYVAAKRYVPGIYDGPVAILRTEQGTRLANGARLLGWEGVVTGDATSSLVTGTHDSMFDEDHLGCLALRLAEVLARFASDQSESASQPSPA
jgi:amino acid adenylation domain-containing protein